ncbi:MAG: DUF3307 domain-containing protein [Chloroflexia bacterium]
MSILFRFLMGHLVGDFVLQTVDLVRLKVLSWKGLLLHAAIVTGSTALFLWETLPAWGPWLIPLFLTHLLTDWGKIALGRRWPQRQLSTFFLDQAVHLGVLALFIFLGSGGRWPYTTLAEAVGAPSPQANRNLLFLCFALVALFIVPLLEAHAVHKVARLSANGANAVGNPAASLTDRLWGGGERLLVLALLYLGGPMGGFAPAVWLIPLAFLPRILAHRRLWKDPEQARDFWTKIAISILSMLALGILLYLALGASAPEGLDLSENSWLGYRLL